MPTIPAGAVIEISLLGRLNAQRVLNVFHYAISAEVPSAQYVAFMDGLQTNFEDVVAAPLLVVLSSQYMLEAIRLQVVWPTRLAYREYSVMTAGAKPGVALPANSSVSVQLRTETAGKGGVGRKQVSGLPAGGVTEGELNGNGMTEMVTATSAWDADLDLAGPYTGDIVPIVWTRGTGINTKRINQVIVKSEVRTQRTRTVGKGE